MNAELYRRACELFDVLWALPNVEREPQLRNLCGEDEVLRLYVAGMLQNIDAADREGFLSGTADSAALCSAWRPTRLGNFHEPRPDAGPRFSAEQIIAGRYRIISRVGVGGMGEVYRAEDLMLGQTVALKFLSHAHTSDPLRLNALLKEVRLGREVSHPNVCRVYDVAEAGGDRFISMEFIEGEDLASQLRRLGPMQSQQARRVAQQICLGLAALHEQGIVHRDLKPGNVVIDGRSRVRIVDFGLAAVAGSEPSVVAGTVGYLAPECLRGEPATAQSDLFSLGRLLENLFAAKQDDRSPAKADSALRSIIARCLEDSPARRPASAIEVARELGWDPLKAARAAGRLPTPRDVADATGGIRLSARKARVALAVVLVGMLLIMQGHTVTSAFPQVRPLPPDSLTHKSRDVLRAMGFTEVPRDRAWNYRLSPGYRGGQKPLIGFWYRESADHLVPQLFLREGGWRNWGTAEVSFEDPPLADGQSFLVLNAANGRLREFAARPADHLPEISAGFSILFEAAGLTESELPAPVRGSVRASPVPCDHWLTWKADSSSSESLLIAGALLDGRPVYFRVQDDDESRKGYRFTDYNRELTSYFQFGDLLLGCLLLVSAWLAPRNLNLGHADRAGALRMAGVMFTLRLGVWLFSAHHVPQAAELSLFVMGVARALFDAALMGIFYVALEPAVRRLWPETLVSWNRLLDGRWQDPLVGSSILAGLALGVFSELIDQLDVLAAVSQFPDRARLTPFWTESEMSLPGIVALLMSLLPWAISMAMFTLLILLILRVALRVQWLAVLALGAIMWALYRHHQGVPDLNWVCLAINALIQVFVLTRLGLLGAVAWWLVHLLAMLPLSLMPNGWWTPIAYSGLALAALLAVFAYRMAAPTALRTPASI